MRILLVGAMLALGCVSAQAASQAFGIRMGQSIDELVVVERGETAFIFGILPPLPNSDLPLYSVLAPPGEGVCALTAANQMSTQAEADELKLGLNDMLESRYGDREYLEDAFPNLPESILDISVRTDDKGWVAVTYLFANHTRCLEELKAAKSEVDPTGL